jgi:hypothetical protein
MAVNAGRALAERVSVGEGRYKPFGEMTVGEVAARAAELSASTGLGHGASRIGAVAGAWTGLAKLMEERGAATVADLDPASVAERAERLWVVPPGGSLL